MDQKEKRMPDIVAELKEKKRKIEDLQRTKARQEGQREQLLKSLKSKFSISSVKESEKRLETFGEELVQHEKSLEKFRNKMDEIISGARQRAPMGESEEEQT